MANVFFKRGTQANFNSLTSWQEGAFYLTTDTQRLYYSDGSKAVQVNPGITTVANVAGLPKANQIKADDYGQFYYCQSENILAIYQGPTNGWVQINASEDTFINQRIVSTEKIDNTVDIEDVLYANDTTKGNQQAPLESHLQFTGENGLAVNVTPKYTKATAFKVGVDYYTLSGSTYTKVTSPSSSGLANYYVQNGYGLTLTAPTYTLSGSVATVGSTQEATITLGGNATKDNTAVFKAGNNVTFENDNGKIKITAADSDTLDSVTGANATSGFDITVAMVGGTRKTGNIDPIIKLGTNADVYKFANGIATLPVYTKTEVDNKIRDFNAMEYKGTLTASGLDSKLRVTQTEHNGWVYMLSENADIYVVDNKIVSSGSVSGSALVQATAGDLIVVQGTEINGVVASPEYIHIPSGNDHDTTYTFSKVTHGISIKKDGAAVVGGFSLEGDNDSIILTDDDSTDPDRKVTISHKTVTINNSSSEEQQFERQGIDIVVPTVTFDSTGHASSIATKTYKVVDTHATITNDIDVSINNNVAEVTSTVTVDAAQKSDSFTVTSDNLTVSTSNNAITMNLEWGSF